MAKVGFQEAFDVWFRQLISNSDVSDKIVKLHDTWAEKDAEFDYLVYKLERNNNQPNGVVANSQLIIDIWTYSQLQRTNYRIQELLIELLDKKLIKGEEIESILDSFSYYDEDTTDNIFSAVRFEYDDDNGIPVDAKNVWRRELRFDLRHDRKREIKNILDREQEKPIWDLS